MARRRCVRVAAGAGLLLSAGLAGLLVSARVENNSGEPRIVALHVVLLDRAGALVAAACLRNGQMGILLPGGSATCTEFLAVPRADLDRVGRVVLRVTRAEVHRLSGGMA